MKVKETYILKSRSGFLKLYLLEDDSWRHETLIADGKCSWLPSITTITKEEAQELIQENAK